MKVRKKRKPMTEEQRAAAAERLAAARAAKGPSQNLSIHESIRDLPDDHDLSPYNVKLWIKEWKLKVSSMKHYLKSKDGADRRQYIIADTYLKNMISYLDTGVWSDSRWGLNRENKTVMVCTTPAYDKNGVMKRTIGVFYADIQKVYGDESYNI